MASSNSSCWIIGLVMMCLVAIFGCIAHAVLLLVILSSPSLRRNPSNSFIISLSLTGLLATSVVFPSAIAVFLGYRSESTKWELISSNCSTNQVPYPSVLSWGMCSVFQAMHNFSIYNSAWLVAVIASERNVFITRPFYTASPVKYALLNIFVTTCSILFALIPIVISSGTVCYSLYVHHFSDPAISWLLLVLAYLLPSLIVVAMYFNIYRVAQSTRNAIRPTPSPYPPEHETAPRVWMVNPIVVAPQSETTLVTNKKCNKAIWTLILTTGIYVTLWSPYWMFYLIKDRFHPHSSFEENLCDGVGWYVADHGSTTVTWLMYLSISINPLLYGIMNRAVRLETKRKLQMTRRFLLCYCMRTETANEEQNGAGQPENFW